MLMSKLYLKWMRLNQMTIDDTDFLTGKPYDTYTCEVCNKEISRISIDKSGDTCPMCENRKEQDETNV